MKPSRILVLSLCACFASVAWGQQPGRKCINNWAEFHKQNMQRWNQCENVLNVRNVKNLHQKWHYPTSGFVVFSSPAVANGVVYLGSGYPSGSVYAVKASTGALLWEHITGGYAYSSPAVANGMVYGGLSGGKVYAQTPAPEPNCGPIPRAATWSPRPPWRMGWCMSARLTATCTR